MESRPCVCVTVFRLCLVFESDTTDACGLVKTGGERLNVWFGGWRLVRPWTQQEAKVSQSLPQPPRPRFLAFFRDTIPPNFPQFLLSLTLEFRWNRPTLSVCNPFLSLRVQAWLLGFPSDPWYTLTPFSTSSSFLYLINSLVTHTKNWMFTSLDSPLTLLGTHTKYKGALFSV